jgi:hypothetical protein
MVDPKMTKFIAISLDKQTTTIEQSAQEALRAKEEMIVVEEAVHQVVVEVAEIATVAPEQDRGFHMAQDAWERGFLMLE